MSGLTDAAGSAAESHEPTTVYGQKEEQTCTTAKPMPTDNRVLKDKTNSSNSKAADETKPKTKSKKSLIPFYTTFGFGNRGSKSPDKDKKRRNKLDAKGSSTGLEHEEDGCEKKDKEKEEEYRRGEELVIENHFIDGDLYIDNKLYGNVLHDEIEQEADQIPSEFSVQKVISSPKLNLKSNNDSKKYSLVKARIAKYQKHSQNGRCSSPEANIFSDASDDRKCAVLDSQSTGLISNVKCFPHQVSNLSYEGLDFKGTKSLSEKDISYDEKALYDELKLIYGRGEIFAVHEQKSEPVYSAVENSVGHRPHLSIDSITLISNNSMKASLNISVSGSTERISTALPDTRWKQAGKFSRRSIRKSAYKKRKESKKYNLLSSANSSNSASPPNELNCDGRSIHSNGGLQAECGQCHETPELGKTTPFPEYAKVNKKRNSLTEVLTSVDAAGVDYRSVAFKGCSEKGPVAKKIGQSVLRNRKESDYMKFADSTKSAAALMNTDSFKGTKVGRKGSFTYNTRPKNIKIPTCGSQLLPEIGNKLQGVKLRRRDSRNGRQGEYRLSVTIQPSMVASLTDKFNSLSQNQSQICNGSRQQMAIPLGQVSLKDGKLGRVYNSPRASFKRKYRTRSHKNKKVHKKPTNSEDGDVLAEILDDGEQNTADTISLLPNTNKILLLGKRMTNMKKVASIGKAPGDNKTDEEKVCDKIETALSSGKFKGETDESDVEPDENNETLTEISSGCIAEIIIKDVRDLPTPSEGAADTHVFPCENLTETLPTEDDILAHGSPKSEEVVASQTTIEIHSSCSNTAVLKEQIDTSSVESISTLLSNSHQKSESIDSGILSDENSLSFVIPKIPETVDEDTAICIRGAIDIDLDNIDNTQTSAEDAAIYIRGAIDINLDNIDNTQTSAEADTNIYCDSDKNVSCKQKADNNFITMAENICDEASDGRINSTCELGIKNDVLTHEILGSIEENESQNCSKTNEMQHDDLSSDAENKIYSSIIKAVVKNTVRRTKEKDSLLKKEFDKEVKQPEKEKWFRRGRSKSRGDCGATESEDGLENCNNVSEVENQTINRINADNDVQLNSNVNKNDDNSTKQTGTKPKIYESWIFKKIREKSQERKKFKEITPVEVSINEEDVTLQETTPTTSQEVGTAKQNKPAYSSNAMINEIENVVKPEEPKSNQLIDKIQKDDGYGLFSFKTRGRNKDKKKTKTTSDKSESSNARKDSSSSSKEAGLEESASNSPASSVKTLHSRKPSDTSVCTVDSDGVFIKSASTKLKATNSQRSTTSIPPPPKTPIPSPPKSARIILNIADSDFDDFKEKEGSGGPGSSENIYENLYSPDLDKLKKNRAKLEERGIVPNSSFLWQEGNPPTLKTSALPTRIKALDKQQPFSKITGIKSFGRPEKHRRDTSLPRIDHSTEDGQNYSELNQISSDDSHTTAAYDEIGGISAVSYDDIRMSASCSYDDIRAPSSVGYDSLKAPSSGGGYDPVNPPPARSDSSQYDECDGVVVTAQLAVVRDQMDSISYFYDDITYNSSQSSHSYEPVNPPGALETDELQPVSLPLAITSIQEVPEPEASPPPVNEENDVEGTAP